jgi:hypothetical protein
MQFTPENIVRECYPVNLPNLYVGKQLIISGRYSEPVPVNIQLTGNAFGESVEYNYELNLSDSIDTNYQFLTKLWAKQKIEQLLIEYYSHPEYSNEAQAIKDEIIEISQDYGIISPFTSYAGPGVENEEDFSSDENINSPYSLVGNFPNPFNPTTTIKFNVSQNITKNVPIKIYNAKGQLVKILAIHVNGAGQYMIQWNGTDQKNNLVSSGVYFYIIDFGDAVLSSKMLLMK